MGKSKSKGFSLFTPLVGTAVVVMTILIASSIVQNDVRISRSITMSYITSSQGISAKLITAAIELHMLETMREFTIGRGGQIATTRTAICAEGDGKGCTMGLEQDIISNPSGLTGLEIDLMAGEGIFKGIFESIELISGYEIADSNKIVDVQKALLYLRTRADSIAKAGWETPASGCAKGKYKVSLLKNVLESFDASPPLPLNPAFSVTFKEKGNEKNKLTISIATSTVYITEDCILDFVIAHEKKFDEIARNMAYNSITVPKTGIGHVADKAYFCVDNNMEYRLVSTWKLSTGEFFVLDYETSGYVTATEIYDMWTSGSVQGADLTRCQ